MDAKRGARNAAWRAAAHLPRLRHTACCMARCGWRPSHSLTCSRRPAPRLAILEDGEWCVLKNVIRVLCLAAYEDAM